MDFIVEPKQPNLMESQKVLDEMIDLFKEFNYKFDMDSSKCQSKIASFSWIKGNIVINSLGTKINSLWIGNNKVNKHNNHFICKRTLEEIEEIKDKKLCSRCNIVVTEFAGSHFAGHFCEKCWEEYKKEHSRVCGICHKPDYRCNC